MVHATSTRPWSHHNAFRRITLLRVFQMCLGCLKVKIAFSFLGVWQYDHPTYHLLGGQGIQSSELPRASMMMGDIPYRLLKRTF
jgi:hypothetical protein